MRERMSARTNLHVTHREKQTACLLFSSMPPWLQFRHHVAFPEALSLFCSATSSFCLDIFEAVPADFVRSAESCLLLLPVAAAVHLRSRLLILIGLSDLFLSSFLSRPRLLRLHHPCNRLPHHLSRLLPLLPLHPQPR